MALNQVCLDGCAPLQVVNLAFPISDISKLRIFDSCGQEYNKENLEYAYSLDSVCWSCYMSYTDALANLIEINSDFYIRFKVAGVIGNITVDGNTYTDYTTSLDTCFSFSYTAAMNASQNLYNPYANMDAAVSLAQQLTENVTSIVGIPCYYFKLSPNAGSKDLTFKEYTLMDVESVKQIKIMILDNQMPSSKPEFNDWGLDWQTDWETEISKGMFATAFGPTAQPLEGDLVYIPMMKRMWMVNEAYEEKKDAFMWNATTFHVTLVKYQEKDSVDLKDTESLVNSFVKNKYEDLFGDHENVGGGEESTDAPNYGADNLYPVFESDATRKYVSTDSLEFKPNNYYYRGTLISDCQYLFNGVVKGKIVYQRQYCGDELTLSFIFTPGQSLGKCKLFKIGNLMLELNQAREGVTLKLLNSEKNVLKLPYGDTYFVFLRQSKRLNIVELSAAKYIHANIPIYKLQNHHFWFDIDNLTKSISKFNIECIVENKSDVVLSSFYGSITNIKIFDIYIDNISEILQMYPTNSHLLINDTARKIVDLNGLTLS